MEKKFVSTDGQHRNGIEKACPVCGKGFITRKDQPHTACSVECRCLLRRDRITIQCAQCGVNFERHKSKLSRSRSGLRFCSRKCKDTAQRLGGIEAIMPPHYGTAKPENRYREQFSEDELVCARCGYDEFKCAVAIHHIDHNRQNNDKSNLLPLCMNCHMGVHNNLWKLK